MLQVMGNQVCGTGKQTKFLTVSEWLACLLSLTSGIFDHMNYADIFLLW